MTDEMPKDVPFGGVDIQLIQPEHVRAKVDFLTSTPFDKTIYLDSDTLVELPLGEMFDLLDKFDVLGTHDWARKRKSLSRKIEAYGQIPYGFSEINGGVLAWKKNRDTDRWLRLWKELYYRYQSPGGRDQATLRLSLWESGVRLYILPVEFNVRSREGRAHVRRQRKKMGNNHLRPRIIHAHAFKSIHAGKSPPSNFWLWRLIMRLRADYP